MSEEIRNQKCEELGITPNPALNLEGYDEDALEHDEKPCEHKYPNANNCVFCFALRPLEPTPSPKTQEKCPDCGKVVNGLCLNAFHIHHPTQEEPLTDGIHVCKEHHFAKEVLKLQGEVDELRARHEGLLKYVEGQKVDIEGYGVQVDELKRELAQATGFIQQLGEGNFQPENFEGDCYEAIKHACDRFLKTL